MFNYTTPTRYDLRFSVFGFPVRVHPLFWLVAILIGSRFSPIDLVMWVAALFVAILIHELGHAFAMRWFGQFSQIILHFGGGLTVPEQSLWGRQWATVGLTPNQDILVSLAGPGAGFLLAAFVLVLTRILGGSILYYTIFRFIQLPTADFPNIGFLNTFIQQLLWISVFWGLINLMPVYPLDGGQVAMRLFVKYDPWGGVRKALWLSIIAGVIVGLVCLVFLGSVYVAVIFGLFAFQNYQRLQGQV